MAAEGMARQSGELRVELGDRSEELGVVCRGNERKREADEGRRNVAERHSLQRNQVRL